MTRIICRTKTECEQTLRWQGYTPTPIRNLWAKDGFAAAQILKGSRGNFCIEYGNR